MKEYILLFLATSFFNQSEAIIGYDCTQKFTNFTTFSLVDVGECDIPPPIVNKTIIRAALMQLNDFESTHVTYCKIVIKRSIFRCGMWSHNAAVSDGEVSFLHEITREECRKLHMFKQANISSLYFNKLRVNDTVTRTGKLAGKLQDDGYCENAAEYADSFGDYKNVVVTGYITVRLEERYHSIDLNNDKIKLNSGTTCKFSEGQCIDSDLGYAFWDTMPLYPCHTHKYTTLYNGPIEKVIEAENSNRPLYVLETNQVSFAFKDLGLEAECTFKLVKTEHPKLFILENPQTVNFEADKNIETHNLDIFAYINSKFVYTERHIKKEDNELYHDVIKQQCNLERKVIANSLGLATIAPDVLAYQLMSGPGYISLLAGEVVHILKCIPVEVTTREIKDCYQELPVKRDERDMFLSPRTHILREYGTRTACDTALPVMYVFGNQWYKVLPGITTQDAPQILKPQTKQSWKYESPIDLANSGIYTYRDTEKLKTFIMFPNERGAVLNQVALGFAGKDRINSAMSAHLFDESALEKIAESTWNTIWSKFIAFGSVSAACLTILCIFRLIKFALDTTIHGYALHSIYGFSIHLLGAFWNALTHLLLHLARTPEKEDNETQHKPPAEPPVNAGTSAQQGSPGQQSSAPPNYAIVAQYAEQTEHENQSQIQSKLYPLLPEPDIPSLPPRKKRLRTNV